MAINSGFFNSVSGDRKYNADEISSLFTGVFKDGVFKTVGNNFMVKAYYGMTVNIDTGRAWFNRRYIENTALLPKVIDASEVLLDRIDTFVIEIDNSDSVRAGDIKYIKGIPSSDPQKPTLTNTENKHQYPIAYIKVNHGVSSISDSNIEIAVGKSECPFVTGVIEGTDVDNLFVQWNAEFGEWFDTVKGQLSSDVAGNLQNQISVLNNKIKTITKTITIQPAQWHNGVFTLNDPLITSTSIQEWFPNLNPSVDEMKVLQSAAIVDYDQGNGFTKIKCLGDIPKVSINLRVNFRGDK